MPDGRAGGKPDIADAHALQARFERGGPGNHYRELALFMARRMVHQRRFDGELEERGPRAVKKIQTVVGTAAAGVMGAEMRNAGST